MTDMIQKILHRLREAREKGPLPLYVSRPLVNADEFIEWAKSQGFEKVAEPKDLHATVLYSKKPMDWGTPEGGNLVVSRGSRTVEPLGDEGAVVLKFQSGALSLRHDHFITQGGSHDYDSYKPHITITYANGDPSGSDGEGVDLKKVSPFRGDLVFGPEVFKVIDKVWKPKEG